MPPYFDNSHFSEDSRAVLPTPVDEQFGDGDYTTDILGMIIIQEQRIPGIPFLTNLSGTSRAVARVASAAARCAGGSSRFGRWDVGRRADFGDVRNLKKLWV